jgi:hypothetical protein
MKRVSPALTGPQWLQLEQQKCVGNRRHRERQSETHGSGSEARHRGEKVYP